MMNIQTVADNLRRTIAGKEKYLAECKDALDKGITSTGVHIAVDTTREFLEINIDELRRILKDVEVCCEQHTEMGWQINPERMGQ
jgi:CBS-domain-containing membrane protein